MRFPTSASLGRPSDHRNTLVLCLRIPSCGLCSVPRSSRWKISAECYLHIITQTRPVQTPHSGWIPCRLYFKWMVMKDVERIGFSYDGSELRFQKYAGRQMSEDRVLPVLEAQKKLSVFLAFNWYPYKSNTFNTL